jgi:hypothetical protein
MSASRSRRLLALLLLSFCLGAAAFAPGLRDPPAVGARHQLPQISRRRGPAVRCGAASDNAAHDAGSQRRQAVVALLVAGVLAPVACANAQGSSAAADERPVAPGGKAGADDKVRRASSGKNVLRDDFCPDPKPGQAILMNCQKAKLKRAKLAKAGKDGSAAKSETAGKTGK